VAISATDSFALGLLFPDVFPYHGFVSTYGRDEVPSGPEVLSHEVPLPLPVYTGQVDRALAFDKPDHLGDSVFRWDRDHHVHVIHEEMAFLNPTFLLQSQSAEDISEVLPQLHIQRLSAALGNEYHMIFALPLRVA
jgi:hypothetical protein